MTAVRIVFCSLLLAAQIRPADPIVKVVATVSDGRGRYVTNLKPDDFIIQEDRQEQKIALFSVPANTPLNVGILLDTSGSMQRKIVRASNAIEDFVFDLHKNDDVFLMSFSDAPKLVSDFNDGRPELVTKLRRLSVGGETALYDTLNDGIRRVRQGSHERSAILLVTDGGDSASSLTFQQVMRAIRESDVLIYCIGISASFAPAPFESTTARQFAGQIIIGTPSPGRGPTIPIPTPGGGTFPIPLPGTVPPPARVPQPPQPDYGDTVNMSVLEALADPSGGRAWRAEDTQRRIGEPIEKILSQLAAEFRSQYILGYGPPHPLNDRQLHDVLVRTRETDLTVRSRKVY